MEVRFDPDSTMEEGIKSLLTWGNPELRAAIRTAFHESPRESIVRIDINEKGILAYF